MIIGAVCDRDDEVGALPFDCFVAVFGTEKLFVKLVWTCSHHVGINNCSTIFPQNILEGVEKVGFFIDNGNQIEELGSRGLK